MSRINNTYQASPQNFFSFSYGESIGERAAVDFLYVKDNHLGNVIATVSDQRIPVNNVTLVAYYLPDVTSTNDFTPFGMLQIGRNFNSPDYKYGFNGMEKDDEVKGSGNSYDFGERIYDSRLAKFLSIAQLPRICNP